MGQWEFIRFGTKFEQHQLRSKQDLDDLEKQIDPANPEAVGARYQAALPSGRYTTAEEIANMVLFLCSDLAANTTGGQFVVDGGRTATGGAVTNPTTR